ncbi:solute carrier family 35 member B1 [Trichonephila clavata]|uniref:Solute carrier family 35 member B1 n=1 Tax=Trichonephila clavata TaxID=2740835 RepID=A0A8X6KRQ1_TRICU|nr:solute carrier family 35 member B1 [Trichonephila clavata]
MESINTIPEIANTLAETFAKTSSCDNYTPAFQALEREEERVRLNFSSSNKDYNSPLTLLEFHVALHRSDLKIRSAKALNILKVLANTRWGADRTSLLRLYRALIRSKLDYGSVVYSSACKSLLKILDPVHHQGLRLCLGAFCTSPVESLYAEAYEPPLDLRRKISEVPPWKVIYPRVDFTLLCYSKACTPVSTYRTLYLEHRDLFSDYEPIFTDGSKSESHVGSAVVSLSTVITDALPISASIYTAELHALRIAIEYISLSCGKKFIIYTDSLSALQSIVSLHSLSHPILVDITYALANHLKKKDIRFCWIPGHAGITGNELADTAVRSATGSSERFPILHSDLKACFRQKLQSVWQSNWDQQTENKLHSVMPVLAPTVPSSSKCCEQVIWIRLHLRHTRLMHSHLLFGEPPPYCEILLHTFMKQGEDPTRQLYYAVCGFSYLGAMVTSNMALQHVNYPTQVVGKSCKPIPVMILGVLIGKKKYPLAKYFYVFMIVVGVCLFVYKDKPATPEADEGAALLGMGEILLLISLTLDGITGAIQDRMRAEYQSKSGHMMYSTNLYSTFILGIAVFVTGEVWGFLQFVEKYPYIIYNMLGFSIMSALGQVFIYLVVSEFGPLLCSIITTTRKFFTVLGSVFLFGNALLPRQWMGTALVFTGLTLDGIYGKHSSSKKK